MSKTLNINVSGGGAAFGSVNQGDKNTVHGSATLTQETIQHHYGIAEKAVRDIARECNKNEEQVKTIIAQLASLKEEVQSGNKEQGKAEAILKTIRENFSWAYPAIKDFAKAVWPLILP